MPVTPEVVAMLALLSLDGCSLFGAHSPASPLLENAGSGERRACTDDYGLPVIDTLVTAVSIAVMVADVSSKGGSCQGCTVFFVPLITIPYAISAIYGYDQVDDCKTARGETDPRITRRRARAVNAWQLTNAAMLASRGGDCATVKRLGPEIEQVDADLYATVFTHDADIARCLRAPETAETPVATPYCFDETADGLAATVCMPSESRCHTTMSGLPLGSVATACRPASDALEHP